MIGAVVSILIAEVVSDLALPARSLTDRVLVRFAPSPLIVVSTGTVAGSTPDSPSVAVQWIMTSPRYQPAAFGAVVGVPASVGAVLSMLIPETVVDALLSAVSVAVPDAVWLAPSEDFVTGPVHDFTPDVPSVQLNVTTTLPLFHPFAFAAGVREPAIDGADLSTFTVTLPVALLPTRSLAVAVLVTPPVSVVTESVAGVGAPATPDPASVADHVIVTLLLFHPAAFGAGLLLPVTTGGVLSRM